MCVLLFDVFNGCSLVKKQIGKRLLRKTDVLKTYGKSKFLGKEI